MQLFEKFEQLHLKVNRTRLKAIPGNSFDMSRGMRYTKLWIILPLDFGLFLC